jgi:ATP-dependent RNA helicase RhlE
MPFSALGLSPELLRAVAEAEYTTPTPVQAAAIPPILHGKDVRGCAQTGSGKTAAYALPMLQRLLGGKVADDRRVSGLIIVPTRELAMQVGESFRGFSRYLPQPIKVLTVFGGVSINPQMMALRGGADIVVATPGRLLDLADNNAVRLGEVSTLVLDARRGFRRRVDPRAGAPARSSAEPAVLGDFPAGRAIAR